MRQPWVGGNWKMNGTLAEARALLDAVRDGAAGISGVEVAVLPPAVYLAEAAARLADSPVCWGAQSLSEHAAGAYTGEIAGSMLSDLGCRYVLVGHSERRTLFGETDAVAARKFLAAQSVGLQPVLCVGETLDEREQDRTMAVVRRQLDAVLGAAGVAALEQAVIAYEPVWAIGTGRTASPEQAQEVHEAIRSIIVEQDANIARSVRIVYGGSVKASNATSLFAMADIDGGLIGGASLKADEFLNIVRAAAQ